MGRALGPLLVAVALGLVVSSCGERYGDASVVDAGVNAGVDADRADAPNEVADSGVDASQTQPDASTLVSSVHCGAGVSCVPGGDEGTCCVGGSACDTPGQCQCTPANACNSPRHYSCDDATDCPSGLICCGVFENVAGGLLLISAGCLSAASCSATAQQRGELCDPASTSAQCPNSMKCAPSGKFPGIGLCIR